MKRRRRRSGRGSSQLALIGALLERSRESHSRTSNALPLKDQHSLPSTTTMSDLSSLVHSEIARLASASLPALDVAQPRSAEELAALIDHTLLAPSSTPADVERVCAEARQFGTATVCVNSSMIPTAVAALKDSSVRPIAVIGFPFGASNTKSKMVETEEAVRQGAKEIDMVSSAHAPVLWPS